MLRYSRIIFSSWPIDFAKWFAILAITSGSFLQFYARDIIIKSYGSEPELCERRNTFSPAPVLAIAVIAIIVVTEIQMRRRRLSLPAIQWGSLGQGRSFPLCRRAESEVRNKITEVR